MLFTLTQPYVVVQDKVSILNARRCVRVDPCVEDVLPTPHWHEPDHAVFRAVCSVYVTVVQCSRALCIYSCCRVCPDLV